MQFDDAFVSKYYASFESAEDMRRSLVATTSMERLKDVEGQVGWGSAGLLPCLFDVYKPSSHARESCFPVWRVDLSFSALLGVAVCCRR